MSEDFEGTIMDLPEQGEEEDSSDDDGEDNKEDITNKMGELGKKEHEGLDKNMWAPEDQDSKVCSWSCITDSLHSHVYAYYKYSYFYIVYVPCLS